MTKTRMDDVHSLNRKSRLPVQRDHAVISVRVPFGRQVIQSSFVLQVNHQVILCGTNGHQVRWLEVLYGDGEGRLWMPEEVAHQFHVVQVTCQAGKCISRMRFDKVSR